MNNEEQLRVGETFLLRAGREYFLSTIESVTDRSLEVTVPSKEVVLLIISYDFDINKKCKFLIL